MNEATEVSVVWIVDFAGWWLMLVLNLWTQTSGETKANQQATATTESKSCGDEKMQQGNYLCQYKLIDNDLNS